MLASLQHEDDISSGATVSNNRVTGDQRKHGTPRLGTFQMHRVGEAMGLLHGGLDNQDGRTMLQ